MINLSSADNPLITCCGCVCSEACLLETTGEPKVCGCPRFICSFLFTIIDILLTPFLVTMHFFKIYIIPCITICCSRIFCTICCALNVCKCRYRDCNFPANDASLGEVDIIKKKPNLCNLSCCCFKIKCECHDPFATTIKWKRARNLGKDIETGNAKHSKEKMRLFAGKIEPSDICQGSLGDCWLLAAIACVAEENSDKIKSLFLTREADAFSCYQVRLFDKHSHRWRTLTIDDRVPVRSDGAPYFSNPHGNELWVLLLEKAYAKMLGNYHALEGGFCADAFTAFTGNDSIVYLSEDETGESWSGGRDGLSTLKRDKMFSVLKKCLKANMLVAAGSRHDGKTDKDAPSQGIVHGHAYTILDAATCNGESIIKLRNPWGSGEWTGKYSSLEDPSWMNSVANTLRGKKIVHEPGTFWMPFTDFCKHYSHIDICVISVSVSNLHLEVNEGSGVCGLIVGVLKGFITFCLCCRGCRTIWFPQRKTTKQIVADYIVKS